MGLLKTKENCVYVHHIYICILFICVCTSTTYVYSLFMCVYRLCRCGRKALFFTASRMKKFPFLVSNSDKVDVVWYIIDKKSMWERVRLIRQKVCRHGCWLCLLGPLYMYINFVNAKKRFSNIERFFVSFDKLWYEIWIICWERYL